MSGFRSKAQWRLFFADPRLRKYAKRKAHQSRNYRSLPRKVRRGRRSR